MRASWKAGLPPLLGIACERSQRTALPLLLGRGRRSELEEAARAVLPVMLGRTDIASGRIGKPDRHNPRRFVGLAVDHDLAPLSGISESRIERLLGTFEDWGWLHWRAAPPGRRRAKRGFLRCAAQPIERRPNGERRGRAAIRVWTDEVWRWLGALAALAEARLRRSQAAAKMADVVRVPVRSLVAQLADAAAFPDAKERPPP